MRIASICRLFGAILLTVTGTSVAIAQSYTVTDLGTLGGNTAQANAINNAGTIVGQAAVNANGLYHAFAYYGGQIHDLGTLGGDYSSANAINSAGTVAGWAYGPGSTLKQAMVYANGSMSSLHASDTYPSVAYGINDKGTIVGDVTPGYIPYYTQYSFIYSSRTGISTSGSTTFRGVNNSDVLVGGDNYGESVLQPVVSSNGTTSRLNASFFYYSGTAYAVNNAGTVVGGIWTNDFFSPTYAFTYYGNQVHYLYTLGGNIANAYAINNTDTIVGSSQVSNGAYHAFTYTGNSLMDLNAMVPGNSGWTLQQANGVNDLGWICGYGVHNGQQRAFLLQPGASVSGRIALEGVSDLSRTNPNVPLGAFTIAFRAPGTTAALYSTTVTLMPEGPGSPFGAFALTAPLAGTFDVALSGPKQLQVVLSNVPINNTATLPDVSLPSGDTNHDNSVDIGDFGTLVSAYGGDISAPGSGYDPAADFNYDGVVDVQDFSVLVNEYGMVGAS